MAAPIELDGKLFWCSASSASRSAHQAVATAAGSSPFTWVVDWVSRLDDGDADESGELKCGLCAGKQIDRRGGGRLDSWFQRWCNLYMLPCIYLRRSTPWSHCMTGTNRQQYCSWQASLYNEMREESRMSLNACLHPGRLNNMSSNFNCYYSEKEVKIRGKQNCRCEKKIRISNLTMNSLPAPWMIWRKNKILNSRIVF